MEGWQVAVAEYMRYASRMVAVAYVGPGGVHAWPGDGRTGGGGGQCMKCRVKWREPGG